MPRDTTYGYDSEQDRPDRGVRNVRTSDEQDRRRSHRVYESPNVRRFEEEESVAARAYGAREKKRGKQELESAQREEENRAAEAAAAVRGAAEYQHAMRTPRMRHSRKVTTRVHKQAAGKLSWILLGVVSTICLFKAFLMLIALGLYTLGQIELFWGAFNLDDVAETVTQPLVWIGVMEEGARISALGVGMWAIVILMMVISYLILIGYYRFWQGVDVFGSIGAFLATTLAIALDTILAPLNIFPWMVLWVLYINASALFLRKH